jgi:hypothetical protein
MSLKSRLAALEAATPERCPNEPRGKVEFIDVKVKASDLPSRPRTGPPQLDEDLRTPCDLCGRLHPPSVIYVVQPDDAAEGRPA